MKKSKIDEALWCLVYDQQVTITRVLSNRGPALLVSCDHRRVTVPYGEGVEEAFTFVVLGELP